MLHGHERARGKRDIGRLSLNYLAQSEIGQQIRHYRRSRKLSLQDVSDQTGISVSTLSKIENNVVELSYTRMMAISEAIGINLTELVSADENANTTPLFTARRSVTKAGGGAVTEAKNYIYEYLNTDISKKQMIPTIATIKSRSLAEYGEFAVHKGEEFVLVLEGEAELHTEHYQPVHLKKGDATYIDSTMPHAMISVGKSLARILFVCTHGIPDDDKPPASTPKRAPKKRARGKKEMID